MKIKIPYNNCLIFNQLALLKIVKYKDILEFKKRNNVILYNNNWNQTSINFILIENELYKDDFTLTQIYNSIIFYYITLKKNWFINILSM